MPAPNILTAEKLFRLIGRPDTPVLIDVRSDEDAAADPRLLPGAMRRACGGGAGLGARASPGASVVVLCAEGHARSEGVAAWLRSVGRPRRDPRGRLRRLARGRAAARARGPHPAARRRWCDALGHPVPPQDRPDRLPLADPPLRRSRRRGSFSWPRPRCGGVAERFGATPFDIEGEDIFWSHRGERCSFDAMVEEFGLATEPLLRLATIVRGADTARLDLAPEAPGLLAASLGLSRMYADDLEQLEAGMAALRRLLSLVPRRDRRDPQLAEQQGGGMTETALQSTAPSEPAHGVPFSEAVRVWLRVAALSFGGPAGQIAVMHRILVDEKRWIGEARFLHALNFCMLLPGPEAQQLAIYLGWLLHRTWGGVVAGVLFVLPGFLAILALSLDLRDLR